MHLEDIEFRHQEDPYFSTTLAKGMLVLQAFSPGGGWMGNKALVERTGLPKATVSRLCRTLTDLGYLHHDPRRGRYTLDVGVLTLVNPYLTQLPIRRIARPLMQQLANACNGSVSLGIAHDTQMVYVESCIDHRAQTTRPDVGTSRSIASSAMGRAYLAMLAGEERDCLMARLRREEKEAWPRMRARIDEEMARFRRQGYTLSLGETTRGQDAIGVAITIPGHDAPYGLNCAIAASRLKLGELETEVAPRLMALARSVVSELATSTAA